MFISVARASSGVSAVADADAIAVAVVQVSQDLISLIAMVSRWY